jgi:hypothetical protein
MNNKQNITNKFGKVLAVPSLCELYPGIYLTIEEKAWKNLNARKNLKNTENPLNNYVNGNRTSATQRNGEMAE